MVHKFPRKGETLSWQTVRCRASCSRKHSELLGHGHPRKASYVWHSTLLADETKTKNKRTCCNS